VDVTGDVKRQLEDRYPFVEAGAGFENEGIGGGL